MEEIEEKREVYNSFIEGQFAGFEKTATMIGYIVERMQEANIISGNVSISGRIKSFKSVYENTGKKAVDDCFGLRIIGPVEDLRKIEHEIKKFFIVDATKDHGRKNNSAYNAIHEMIHVIKPASDDNGKTRDINSEKFPEIEIQYWDEELMHKCLYGELSYAKYKSKDLQNIMSRLAEDRDAVLADLPMFYIIEGERMKALTAEETLYKMYPEIKRLERIENIKANSRKEAVGSR